MAAREAASRRVPGHDAVLSATWRLCSMLNLCSAFAYPLVKQCSGRQHDFTGGESNMAGFAGQRIGRTAVQVDTEQAGLFTGHALADQADNQAA